MKRLKETFELNKILKSKGCIGVIWFLITLTAIYFTPYSIVYVGSESIPIGLYYIDKTDKKVDRDSIYCFIDHHPEWVSDELPLVDGGQICKRAIGMPGDIVSKKDGNVLIEVKAHNELTVKSFPYVTQLNGIEVKSELAEGEIPAGMTYFGSNYVGGWDSRYFGLIPQSVVIGKATKIF